MLGVCEFGLVCQPDGLGHVFMHRFKGGPAFRREIVFPRGVCKGERLEERRLEVGASERKL